MTRQARLCSCSSQSFYLFQEVSRWSETSFTRVCIAVACQHGTRQSVPLRIPDRSLVTAQEHPGQNSIATTTIRAMSDRHCQPSEKLLYFCADGEVWG